MIARAVFFLPVILASGVIFSIESGDFLQSVMSGSGGEEESAQTGLRSFQLEMLLLDAGINQHIITYLTEAVNRIYDIVWVSGVHIIIFFVVLQSISSILYDVAIIVGVSCDVSFF